MRLCLVSFKMTNFRCYEMRAVSKIMYTLPFPTCKKDYVVIALGSTEYAYYKRYEGYKFYRLSDEELSFMHLAGEEIPF